MKKYSLSKFEVGYLVFNFLKCTLSFNFKGENVAIQDGETIYFHSEAEGNSYNCEDS